jgi:hypothetical protein
MDQMDQAEETMFRVKEVAAWTKTSEKFWYEQVKKGKVRGIYLSKHALRLPREEVERVCGPGSIPNRLETLQKSLSRAEAKLDADGIDTGRKPPRNGHGPRIVRALLACGPLVGPFLTV